MANKTELINVTIYDNGAAFCVCANGLITSAHNTLGGAWEHIEWMHAVAGQNFTVGQNKIPVTEWLDGAYRMGFIEPWHSRKTR